MPSSKTRKLPRGRPCRKWKLLDWPTRLRFEQVLFYKDFYGLDLKLAKNPEGLESLFLDKALIEILSRKKINFLSWK